MSAIEVEESLRRVLAYLRGAGLEVDPPLAMAALRLIEQVLSEHPNALLETVMARLPEHFTLPQPALPPSAPPVHHGSLHHAERL